MTTVAEIRLDTLPPSRLSLRVVVTLSDEALTLTVHGEADVCAARHLRDQMMAALPTCAPTVVVDVAELSFCDLAGTDAVRDFVRAATAGGAQVDLRGMSPLMAWMYGTFTSSEPSSVTSGLRR